ncbi:MAG: hypothetical protein F4089_10335 [Gammaproteobacteria bacterium]|nr:hypothetical protein [Gammaproteobacteria bacterium]
MQRPIQKPVGTRVEELDTPALVLDLDTFEDVASGFVDSEQPARAEAWVHKTPAIAAKQLALSGVVGIAVRSIAEAEVFAAAGFDDIRIMRGLVTVRSRQRAAALATTATLVFQPDRPLCGADWFHDAVTVSTRVVGVPEPGRAILDAGQKAVGRDFGDPVLLGHEDCTASAGSAEHGIALFPGPAAFAIGDWLQLVPADMATVFALHDFVYAVRDGRLEAVWPVAARGAF